MIEFTTVGSGSYAPSDVHFLLRPMQIDTTPVEEKERLIQTNQRHYSAASLSMPSSALKSYAAPHLSFTAQAPPLVRS